jgi:glutaredoxin
MRRVITVVLLGCATSAGAQLYRWTDDAGKTHFTDTPPPASARNVQKKALPPPPSPSGEPFALQEARRKFPVKLYTAPACDVCNEARALLKARGIPFAEISVTDNAAVDELKNVVGSNTVPALVVGASPVNGFEATSYHRLLDTAGYPKGR